MSKLLLFALLGLLIGCTNPNTLEQDLSWQSRYDFDQDNKIDTISYTYSGGAHCCYYLSINLSSLQQEVEIPYEIEGGYMFFDLSKPDNFNILDIDKDERPEIFIKGIHTQSSSTKRKNLFIDFERGGKYFNSIQYKPFNK